MEVKLGVMADFANITQDNKLNILGIFGGIRAKGFPCVHPSLHLVLILSGASSEQGRLCHVRIRLAHRNAVLSESDTQPVLDLSNEVLVPPAFGPKVEMQQIYALNLLQFPTPGEYLFHILLDGHLKAELPLLLEEMPPLGLEP